MKIIILILSIFMLSGCYDYNELNKLEIVSSIILDYEDDMYKVNLEILNTSKEAEKGTYLLSGEGNSIEEAINNVYYDSEYVPYFSHMNALIISNSVAKRGLDESLEYLLRDALIRKDFYVFVADDIDSFLAYKPEKTESLGLTIKNLATLNARNNGRYKTCIFREIIYHYLRNNNYLLGSVIVEDDKVMLDSSHVFIDNKLSFDVEEEVSLFDNILYEGNKTFQVYGDASFNIHEYSLNREIKKDKIILELQGSARLLDGNNKKSFSKQELEKLEKTLNSEIEKLFNDVINYSKKKNEDIFNFNYFYYLYYPKSLDSDTWKNIKYEVKSSVKISEKGLLLDSLRREANAK